MKISLKWLRELIDLQEISNEEIISKLTAIGLEVESVEDYSSMYKNIVVGYVKEKQKHPNADKLSVTVVTDGQQEYQVVCGAPNCQANKKVVFAKVGAYIPEFEQTLSKAKIRGIESFGMLCSEKELKLSDNHDGIMILEDNAPLGEEISKYFGMDDCVVEIGITPNRPDALSHIGVARDLAASFNKKVKLPEVILNEGNVDVNTIASVEVLNVKDCPRYAARVVKNVTVKESPDWLKNKLKAIGLRPINNIVDITNYLLYETGQPLHAFDLNRLEGNKIIVRSAEEDTKFTTLDSKERIVPKGSLFICDAEKPVALAGIMGGENSEIKEDTKDVLIECAYFNPSVIRKTAKKLQLSTDSSYRFERGCDPNNISYVVDRTAQLIAELAGGEICKGVIDIYPEKISNKDIKIRLERITRVLGFEIPKETIKNIFIGLGFIIKEENNEYFLVEVPTFRPDIDREIDLIEEVARIYGYDNIPVIEKITIPMKSTVDQSEFCDKVRNYLISTGCYEIVSNSLQKEDSAKITGNPVKVLNPISADLEVLRTSLLQGALITVRNNVFVGEKSLKLFEIGKVFNLKNENIQSFADFTEEERLSVILTGNAVDNVWYERNRLYDFYDLKGILDSLFSKIGYKRVDYKKAENSDTYYNGKIEIYVDNQLVGNCGYLSSQVLKKFDINQKVIFAEIWLEKLKNINIKSKKFKELQKYPKVHRDMAFIVDKSVNYDQMKEFILKNSKNILKLVEPFDIFESEEFGKNKKSIAIRLEYYDENQTLTEEVVEKEFVGIIEKVCKQFDAQLRGEIK
ncbi:MAG TPA: phenylalanine--tRNA ligase subunit beta [Ignavibacteriales bacterium]|nr:phenylalanine--tRNA ligase subunit beta [Ignavibacteriales bacterium]